MMAVKYTPGERLYSLREVGAFLQLSYPTVLRAVKAGDLKGVRIRARLRFSREAIDEFMVDEVRRAAAKKSR